MAANLSTTSKQIDTILVLDFGSQYTQLIARRVRESNVYSEILPWDINEENSKTINGLITEHLDFIPQANLCLQIEKYKYEILDIEDNFISRVKIKREA